MKKIALGLLLLSICTLSCAGFVTGNELQRLGRAHERWNDQNTSYADIVDGSRFISYIVGVVDSLENWGIFCLPNSVTAGQLAAVVMKSLKENPESWNQPGDVLVAKSLQIAFPCKK